jgi:SLT domain-containing protein
MPIPTGNDGLDLTSLPGYASGGLLSANTWAMVGENGPEVMSVGQTSRIYNARDTASMMSGGGSSVTNHSWNIDARGATDPAAVHAAVQRGIAHAAPHIIAASDASHTNNKSRKPSSSR